MNQQRMEQPSEPMYEVMNECMSSANWMDGMEWNDLRSESMSEGVKE